MNKAGGVLVGIEADGKIGAEFFYHNLLFHTENAFARSAHSEVGDVACFLGQYALVARLNVRVGAEKGGNLTVKIVRQRKLFARCFRVEVNKPDFAAFNFLKRAVCGVKRIFKVFHEHCSGKIDNAHLNFSHVDNSDSPAGRRGRIVVRPDDAVAFLKVIIHFRAAESVVPRCDEINSA